MTEPKEAPQVEVESPEEELDSNTIMLREAGVPDEVIAAIPKWKTKYGGVRVAFIGEGAYIYKKLTWGEMKTITNTLANLTKNAQTSETQIAMTDIELQLEKALLYPRFSAESSGQFPAGDLETLQQLVTEYSGYVRVQPVVEDL